MVPAESTYRRGITCPCPCPCLMPHTSDTYTINILEDVRTVQWRMYSGVVHAINGRPVSDVIVYSSTGRAAQFRMAFSVPASPRICNKFSIYTL